MQRSDCLRKRIEKENWWQKNNKEINHNRKNKRLIQEIIILIVRSKIDFPIPSRYDPKSI